MSYQWILNGTQILSNEKNPVFTFKDAGDYRLTLVIRNQGGCSDTITWAETIQAGQEVVASFLSDPPAPIEITGDQRQIYFKDNTPGASEWFWDFGDGNTSNTMNPTHVYAQPGTYQVTLKIRTNGGCEATAVGGPYTIKRAELSISNVFTPNGDGVNDVFYPDYTGDDQFYFQIFDRWGVKIFETRSRQQGWDGRDLNGQVSPEGVYFYTVKAGTRDLTGSISLVK
jgi:gliding motility-associated-like protein